MKRLLAAALLFWAQTLSAQGAPDICTGLPLGNNCWLSARSPSNHTETKILKVDGSGNTVIGTATGKTADIQAASSNDIISRFGRDVGGTFQSLVEVRNRQDLTGSGEDLGRGAIRLLDTVGSVGEPSGRTMEIGYYAYGGGIFTSSLFEMWVDGLSVRNLDTTASYIEARDGPDAAGLRIRHDSTYGYVTTTGTSSTGIRICPDETCSWSAITSGGHLSGDSTNGGNLVFNKSGSTLSIQEATPTTACMGVATPNGTTNVAVSTTCATTGARVFYSRKGAITNMGAISTTVDPSGTGFSFASANASDNLASSVIFMIVKES